jgi:tripartite-type tricarboxylate transporter receptor subunit TctC
MKAAAWFLCAVMACFSVAGAWAQAYPTKPIRLISPYPPGGGTDATARIIAQALSEQMGQQIVIENRAGASGRIGTEAASKSPADGYTLVLGNVAPLAILPAAMGKLPYDPIGSFNPISLIATTDYVLVVHPSLPVRSMQDLIALAKARPGELTYASSGYLGAPHLAGELLSLLAKVKLVHVPYKGNGPAAIGVMTGESTMLFGTGPSTVPHINSGRMRALATTGRTRSMPDLPTVAESLKDFDVTQWYGILAPAGVPQAVVERLNKEIARGVANPKYAKMFVNLGTVPVSSSPAEFSNLIKSEITRWGTVMKSAGIKAE